MCVRVCASVHTPAGKGTEERDGMLRCMRCHVFRIYMYVCMYVYVYVSVCMCVCMCVRVYTYVCMYVRVYTSVCMYVRVYTYVCMYVRVYAYVCMYVRVYTYVCMYVRVYTYVCMLVRVYTYVCMYVCVYVCVYVCACIYVRICPPCMPKRMGVCYLFFFFCDGRHGNTCVAMFFESITVPERVCERECVCVYVKERERVDGRERVYEESDGKFRCMRCRVFRIYNREKKKRKK